jgi:transcriptional regulator with XRE-family HTH domain
MKMKQPELGRKIAELRKSKGLTQEELVDKCNLNVRTLQRIEAGEVIPRSHTIKVIFAALDYGVFDSSSPQSVQFFNKVLDLFNLKINTMKKVSILTAVFAVIAIVLLAVCMNSNAQSASKVKKIIDVKNIDFVRWFNNGHIDSLMTLYSEDACLVAKGCGINFVRKYYESQSGLFRFVEISSSSIDVSGSIAVERGQWVIQSTSGGELSGEYLTEWRKIDKKWLIVNDISGTN